MDLTEICAPRITKLSSIESKNQLIMASNGSLISAGKLRVNQLMASVPRQIVSDDLLLEFVVNQTRFYSRFCRL